MMVIIPTHFKLAPTKGTVLISAGDTMRCDWFKINKYIKLNKYFVFVELKFLPYYESMRLKV